MKSSFGVVGTEFLNAGCVRISFATNSNPFQLILIEKQPNPIILLRSVSRWGSGEDTRDKSHRIYLGMASMRKVMWE